MRKNYDTSSAVVELLLPTLPRTAAKILFAIKTKLRMLLFAARLFDTSSYDLFVWGNSEAGTGWHNVGLDRSIVWTKSMS